MEKGYLSLILHAHLPFVRHPEFDEFLCFLGGNLENMFDFDADIELSLGKERVIYKINKATIVYIPKGLYHCPLNFKRINDPKKPILFHDLFFAPEYGRRA